MMGKVGVDPENLETFLPSASGFSPLYTSRPWHYITGCKWWLQKEQDYCVFGLIDFMMARLRSNAIVHCACERDGRPTRLCIETLQSHSQHRRSSYSLTAPEEDAVEKQMILLYQNLMENGLEQAVMFRNFLAGKRDTSDGVHRSFFTLNSQDKVWYMLPVQGGWLFCYRFYRKITSTVEQ
ncbi:uncharacterized protein LOC108868466 isoform X6 [Pyrus x bretschneideri]|uniref:uncharacterized protein LOC108868466 isoform X6 n=1 Tax=Pyrus x bretschneideri TaxID=225117 RepID=UPI00202E0912|nr:uncharacterized protein LOC108868466 isoform X6 [Pyrus x bretschneideri]